MDLKFAEQRLLLILRTRLKLIKRVKIGTYPIGLNVLLKV